jgi:hypothetical protein
MTQILDYLIYSQGEDGAPMNERLTMEYDRTGDILYLGKIKPYAEQESEELEFGIIARRNPETGEIENLEILSFSERSASGKVFELPVFAEFRSAQVA